MATESGWAIASDFCGLYIGWQMTRNAAIGEHVSALTGIGCHNHFGKGLSKQQSAELKKLQRKGDRAVKIKITYARR